MCRAEETKAVSKSQGLSPVGVVLENSNPESLVFAFTRQKLEERLRCAPFFAWVNDIQRQVFAGSWEQQGGCYKVEQQRAEQPGLLSRYSGWEMRCPVTRRCSAPAGDLTPSLSCPEGHGSGQQSPARRGGVWGLNLEVLLLRRTWILRERQLLILLHCN